MILRALILALMILWAGAAEATFTYNGTQQGSYGSNLLSNPTFEATPTEWPCSNVFGGACYSGGAGYIGRVTNPVYEGTYSGYLRSQYDSYEGAYSYDKVLQNVTLTAYKEYKIEAQVRDTATSAGLTIKATNTGETANLCTVTDTASNQDVWTYVTCTITNTNTITAGRILIYGSDTPTGQPISYYVDDVKIREYTPPGNDVKLNLPAGSTGRKVYLYNTSGDVAYTATVTDTLATVASVTTGTYFWYITDTDGVTFLDNSDWVTVTNGDEFTWTNSGLAKDATWGFVIAGDSNSNGNCLDNGDSGCSMKLTRNGSEYLFMGSGFGTNYSIGATASASSATNPASYAIDGNFNTKWYTTSTSGQWLCIDFGTPVTRNRVVYFQKTELSGSETGFGGNSVSVQVSPDDTGCTDAGMATISGATEARKQEQFVTSIGFPAQTKRYWRLYYTTVYTRPEAYEVQFYNEGASNVPADIEYLVVRKDSDLSSNFVNGLKYDSYVTESDGSVTFTKNVTGWFNLSVNYKQMSTIAWRKRVLYSTSMDAASEFKFTLHKYAPAGCFYVRGSQWDVQDDDYGACGSAAYDSYSPTSADKQINLHTYAFGTPYIFGITPDSGCYAQWYDSPENYYGNDQERIVEQKADDNWTQMSSVLSRKQEGGTGIDGPVQKPSFITKAGQTYTFDVVIYRSVTPTPYMGQKNAYVSYADAKGQTLSDDVKTLWSVAHQKNYITNNNDQCLQIRDSHNAGRGATAGTIDYTWSLIGLSDQDLYLKNLRAYRKSAGLNYSYGNGSSIVPEDPFNSTPTMTGNSKNAFISAILLGYAVQKGWVSVQSSCSNDLACVTAAERDAVLAAVQAYFPTSGTVRTYGMHLDNLGSLWYTNNWGNAYDSYTNTLIMYYFAYKSLQAAGANVDLTRLANAKAELQALYDATDGYVHFSKFGHAVPQSSGVASGGQFYELAGDPIAPATARFVAPVGGAATAYVRKAGDYGNMAVLKNGIAISGSPFDMYDTSGLWAIYDINYEELWNSGGYENLLGKQTRTYGTAPPVAEEMYGKSYMVPHYKTGLNFASSNNTIQIRAKSYANGPTGIQVFFVDGVDCTGISWTCRQYFPNVLLADGQWHDIDLVITDPLWTDGDNITQLRFDLVDQTSLGTVQFDWVKVSDGVTPTTISDFNVDGPFTTIDLGTASAGDVYEFYATNTKNASSAAYKFGIDKVDIGANNYEENNVAFACDDYEPSAYSYVLKSDCKNGYTTGWKRWKTGTFLLYELLLRNLYSDSIFTTAQLRSHIEKLPTGNQGYGTYALSQAEDDWCIPTLSTNVPFSGDAGYFTTWAGATACNLSSVNGGSSLVLNLAALQLAKEFLNDDALLYRLDEKTDKIVRTGTWTNESITDARWNISNIRNIASQDNGIMYAPISNTNGPYIGKDVPDFPPSYNRISLRVRNFRNGPTGITVYFGGGTCSGGWHSCGQTFNGVLTADNTWQVVNLDMTHADWVTNNITALDIQFNGATALDTLLVDYVRRSQSGANEVTFDEFSSSYYRNYVWKSSTVGSTLELSTVPFSDVEVYMTTGADQGSVKIYFDNGSGYDAGTTVDLATASNPVYSQTGLAYGSSYKVKIEALSGTVRLDYMRTKTKPSYLMTERFKEEYYDRYYVKEYIATDHTDTYYRNDHENNLAQTYHLIFLGKALMSALGGFESLNPGLNAGPNAGIQGRSNDAEIYKLLMQ